MEIQKNTKKMFITSIVSSTLCLPFLIGDLVYAMKESPCLNQPIPTQPSMNMQIWMINNSIVNSVFTIIILLMAFKLHIKQQQT